MRAFLVELVVAAGFVTFVALVGIMGVMVFSIVEAM